MGPSKIVKDIIDFLRAPIQSDNENVLIPRQTLYIRTIIEILQYSTRHNQMRTPIWFHNLFGSLHDRARLLLYSSIYQSNTDWIQSIIHTYTHTQKKEKTIYHQWLKARKHKESRVTQAFKSSSLYPSRQLTLSSVSGWTGMLSKRASSSFWRTLMMSSTDDNLITPGSWVLVSAHCTFSVFAVRIPFSIETVTPITFKNS